jgi:hypothetical protein
MELTETGGMSAILRQGDYFILRCNKQGVEVEYAPDGDRGAPINGAFAAFKGKIKVWSPDEATEILQEHGHGAEKHLLRAVTHTAEPIKGSSEYLAGLIKAFAEEYSATMDPLWRGFVDEFHENFINKVHPSPLTAKMKRSIVGMQEFLRGFHVETGPKGTKTKDYLIKVDWSEMASGD